MQMVVLVSLAIAFVGVVIMSIVMKVVSAKKSQRPRKLPFPIGELPLDEDDFTDEEKRELERREKLSWIIRTEKAIGKPVSWFDGPEGRAQRRTGTLLRRKGRRVIIRTSSGRRIRRQAYLVYKMNDGQPLRPTPISKEHGDVTAYLVDIERKLETASAT